MGAAGATTSVFSRSDGIVAWRGSAQPGRHNPHTENIEVVASHIAGYRPEPAPGGRWPTGWPSPDQWRPFDRQGRRGFRACSTPIRTADACFRRYIVAPTDDRETWGWKPVPGADTDHSLLYRSHATRR